MSAFVSYETLENEKRPEPPAGGIFLKEGQYVYPPFLQRPPPPPAAPTKLRRRDLPKAVEHGCPLSEPMAPSKSSYSGSTVDQEITNKRLNSTKIKECALSRCFVRNCNSIDCSFTDCVIVGGILKDVALTRCEVWMSSLDDMSSTNGKFSECEIHEAELINSRFLNCKVKSSETKKDTRAQGTRFTDCTISNDAYSATTNAAVVVLLFSKQCKFIMCGGQGLPEDDESSSSDDDNGAGWGVQGSANGGGGGGGGGVSAGLGEDDDTAEAVSGVVVDTAPSGAF